MDLLLAAAAGAVAALLATPAGVSGAVFLLPLQVGLLGVSPAVAAPTNLVFNLASIPGGLARSGGLPPQARRLAVVLAAAASPGMLLGAALRATGVVDGLALRAVVAAVLAAVGAWLLIDAGAQAGGAPAGWVVGATAAGAGVLGGLYGIGGGALLAPMLVAMGAGVALVAVPALVTTLITSAAGLGLQLALVAAGDAPGPDWRLGLALGAGGLVGAAVGGRIAPRLPRRLLRIVLGAAALVAGALYLILPG